MFPNIYTLMAMARDIQNERSAEAIKHRRWLEARKANKRTTKSR